MSCQGCHYEGDETPLPKTCVECLEDLHEYRKWTPKRVAQTSSNKEENSNTADATTNKQSDVIRLLREVYYYRLPHGVKVSDIIYEHNEGLSQLVYNTLNDTHL